MKHHYDADGNLVMIEGDPVTIDWDFEEDEERLSEIRKELAAHDDSYVEVFQRFARSLDGAVLPGPNSLPYTGEDVA